MFCIYCNLNDKSLDSVKNILTTAYIVHHLTVLLLELWDPMHISRILEPGVVHVITAVGW